VEILKNLDQGHFKSWDLQSVFDTANQTKGTDFRTDVLEQPTDECCGEVRARN
jgi:hypothetical protein